MKYCFTSLIFVWLMLTPAFADAYSVSGLLYGEVPGWPSGFGNLEYGISLTRRAID